MNRLHGSASFVAEVRGLENKPEEVQECPERLSQAYTSCIHHQAILALLILLDIGIGTSIEMHLLTHDTKWNASIKYGEILQ